MALVPGFHGKYGEETFSSLECLGGVNTLLFFQLCSYHFAEISRKHNLGVWSIYHQTNNNIQSNSNKQLIWLKMYSNHLSLGRMD